MVTITPVDDNNKDIFSPESLVGEKLLKDVKGPPVSTANFLKESKPSLIGLYFSASWCPPCQRFTPLLTEFYLGAKASKSGLEIIFVSSDRGLDEFNEYYKKMPWLAIPAVEGSAKIKQNLSNTLGVTTIPSIAIIDAKTGEIVLGGEARDDIIQAAGNGELIAATIEKWKNAERHPLSGAPRLMDAGSTGRNPFFKFLSFLAKNPMMIFGLIYFYKWMRNKMIDMGYDEEDGKTEL
eukprot:CAMPEP_0172365864 /NCGR_PEP_ID=MMETSP1060-20121228/12282_1 /TAXON_ID=37318 /ORGANISM="Pseudo-nitzschia pungens, Strain cf. cingulata" /LENGTH=236 /DNA_ID=CAMNT_0013089439 /DNA_START=94 /DNA_END=804 /DNA_ORIENTATION=+